MDDYLGKMHALFHEFIELLPPASTLAQELEQRSRFFMVLTLHRLVDKYSHVRDQILGSPFILNFTSTCFHVNHLMTYLFLSMIPLLWHLNVMILIALARKAKGVPSVTIVASMATKFTSVMFYMIVLLNLLLLLLRLILSYNHLLWMPLHLLLPTNLLSSMTFLNCVRIVSPLVSLLLLHI